MAAGLEARGADFLVIPCNTAYVFENAILAVTSIPLISIITESVEAVRASAPAATSVGLLATDGCLQAGIYQAGIEAAGMTAILQTTQEVDEIMTLINAVKACRQDEQTATAMSGLAAELVSRSADAIIAGCTEIPLVLDDGDVTVPLISSTDALALKTVKLATGEEPLPSRQ